MKIPIDWQQAELIPMPVAIRHPGSESAFFRTMLKRIPADGQTSFLMPRFTNAIYYVAKSMGVRVAIRKMGEQGWRVWKKPNLNSKT